MDRIITLLLLCACGPSPDPGSTEGPQGEQVAEPVYQEPVASTAHPSWVDSPFSGIEDDPDLIYAVGVAAKHDNRMLQTRQATARARREIASTYSTTLKAVVSSYYSAAGDWTDHSQAISSVTVPLSYVVDNWADPDDGTLYVRVVADLRAHWAEALDEPIPRGPEMVDVDQPVTVDPPDDSAAGEQDG